MSKYVPGYGVNSVTHICILASANIIILILVLDVVHIVVVHIVVFLVLFFMRLSFGRQMSALLQLQITQVVS